MAAPSSREPPTQASRAACMRDSSEIRELPSQHSSAVDYGRNGNLMRFDMVDNTIAVNDPFADLFVVEFRNLAAGHRKLCERLGCRDNFSNHGISIERRICSDIDCNRFNIRDSARRPDYSVSHWLRRFSTSSCEIVPCCSASSSPWRTLSST